jgi:hypothetical protein
MTNIADDRKTQSLLSVFTKENLKNFDSSSRVKGLAISFISRLPGCVAISIDQLKAKDVRRGRGCTGIKNKTAELIKAVVESYGHDFEDCD